MNDLTPFDFQRIFIGDAPWWFSLEIAFRTTFIYLFAIIAVRLVSRRAIGQLSFIEFLLVIALGSAVGDPMFYPEVPLLHGMVVIAVVVLLNRSVTWLVNRSEPLETALEGVPHALVKEGRIEHAELRRANLNLEKLFELLRQKGVRQLGELERVFMEQRGDLSVYRLPDNEHRPGLRVMPPWDLEPPTFFETGEALPTGQTLGCKRCGYVEPFDALTSVPACSKCGGSSWVDAVTVPERSPEVAKP